MLSRAQTIGKQKRQPLTKYLHVSTTTTMVRRIFLQHFFSCHLSGKVFVKDFFEELRQGDLEVDEEEVARLTAFADEDGQVTKDGFKTYCKHSELFQSLDKWVIKAVYMYIYIYAYMQRWDIFNSGITTEWCRIWRWPARPSWRSRPLTRTAMASFPRESSMRSQSLSPRSRSFLKTHKIKAIKSSFSKTLYVDQLIWN